MRFSHDFPTGSPRQGGIRNEPPGDRTLNLLIKSLASSPDYEQTTINHRMTSALGYSCKGIYKHPPARPFSHDFPTACANASLVEVRHGLREKANQ